MRLILAALTCVAATCGAARTALAQEASFQTPSGNIACAMFDDAAPVVRCDIRDYASSFARPDGCDLDWGYAFEVGASGQGYPLCAGDTVAVPGAGVLGYGQSVTLGGITCTSGQTGMTCANGEGGGFTLAKAHQQVF